MSDSKFHSKHGLIQIKPQTPQRSFDMDTTQTPGAGYDFCLTLTPNDLKRRLIQQQHGSNSFLGTSHNFTLAGVGDETSVSDRSLLDGQSELQQQTIFKEKMDMLFPQFVEVLQGRSNDSEVFDTIQDLIQTCAGVLEEVQKELQQTNISSKQAFSSVTGLEQEMKTWKLLSALYKDRVLIQTENADLDCDMPPLGASEKEVIVQLYSYNSTLREYQLIVDWLEACYDRRDLNSQVGHSTDRTVGWENTLFQLKSQKDVAFGTGVEIVKFLDPDAPIREKRPLHALDEEDNVRLSKCIFNEIRQGRIDEAMALCKYCGQTWRAAILEGWRLHDDPNYEPHMNVREKLPIEGNPRRDLWKKCAWLMADSKKFDEYTRAISGAFCGHLESLKTLLNNSWDDLLWAYLKVQIDIRVESEIRTCCMKSYLQMPETYWNAKMSLEQIFDELAVHNDAAVRDFAKSKVGVIQKFLILDNISELIQQMQRWVRVNPAEGDVAPLPPHMLRFLTHIVLFLRQIGRVDREELADQIIAAYVESLIGMEDAQLVAFYTAALPGKSQVTLYSRFLEGVMDSAARTNALEQAINAGLDVENITRHTVELIRERLPCEADLTSNAHGGTPQVGDISTFDQNKIRALEWLTFLPAQRGELLWQANAIIRYFLAEGKAECVRVAYEMVPPDSLAQIISIYGSKDNFPCREECSVKEYLSYKVYITAIDNFTEWSHLYHNRPKEPPLVNVGANFTERVASEHNEQVYRAEINRWTVSLEEQSKVTRDALYNVLLFPDKGWLIDPDTSRDATNVEATSWENRQIQLEKLRSICIPEVVLLLHKVLHMSGDFSGCIKLADEISGESRQLYKVYTKHKLAELLSKLAESSLELLNSKLDPWGFPVTV